jgi:hypothetical protein
MKKFVNIVSLFVLVASNIFTPISYAIDDENINLTIDSLLLSETLEPLIIDEGEDVSGENVKELNVLVEVQDNDVNS